MNLENLQTGHTLGLIPKKNQIEMAIARIEESISSREGKV